jgi:2-amino-4-hydroxy-6-hydroxymethyldihydropteridine diphosphokinase
LARLPVIAYIGLGANLGDPSAAVRRAIDDLAALHGTRLTASSSLYRSAPMDSSGPDYVNAVVEISTLLTAPALLAAMQALELCAGRERPYINAPRTLDLDLLLYGQARVDSAQLQVPHPRMHQRAFVLAPLREIAPHLVTPAQWQLVQPQQVQRTPN